MIRFRGWRITVTAAAMLGTAAGLLTPVAAAPLSPASSTMTIAAGADAIQVRGRGHGGDAGAAVAAGVAGLIIGGIVAGQQRDYYDGPYYRRGYYGPAPIYGAPVERAPGWEAYCFSRYRSFDPMTGTYLGFDGRRHYCQ